MAVLDFPANPVLNQEYNFPPFRYRWDGEKWRTIGTGANPVQTQIAEHRVEKDAHAIETITNLREELSALGGTPVLSVVWVQRRDAMWPGYIAADGQTLSRADYADAWKAINDNKVPAVLDSEWLADNWRRGCFTPGDGSTTFRIPDYNGKYAGSLGAVFLRGDGLNSAGTDGVIQGDAIRNITGNFGMHGAQSSGTGGTALHSAYGVFSGGIVQSQYAVPNLNGSATSMAGCIFDASTVVPTASDNHPVNVTGCWAIKLAGAAQNSGQIDALALVSQVAALQANKVDKEIPIVTQGGVVNYRVNSSSKMQTSTPNWFIADHALRFLDGHDLMQATTGTRSPIDTRWLGQFKFEVRLRVHAPSINIWLHNYTFTIGNYQTTNSTGNYSELFNFSCHSSPQVKGVINVQHVPGSDNDGCPYYELHYEPGTNIKNAPDKEIALDIVAIQLWT